MSFLRLISTVISIINGQNEKPISDNNSCCSNEDNDNNVKNTGMLIKAIANNCPKIKMLSTFIEQKDFIYLKLFLLNCRFFRSCLYLQ